MVEGTGLENRQAGNRLVGSNPTLSATISLTAVSLRSMPPRGRPKSWPAALAPLGSKFEVSPEFPAIHHIRFLNPDGVLPRHVQIRNSARICAASGIG